MENTNKFSVLSIKESCENSKNNVQIIQCKFCNDCVSILNIEDHEKNHQTFCRWCENKVIDVEHSKTKCKYYLTTICNSCRTRVTHNHDFTQCYENERLYTRCNECKERVKKGEIVNHLKSKHSKNSNFNKNNENSIYRKRN